MIFIIFFLSSGLPPPCCPLVWSTFIFFTCVCSPGVVTVTGKCECGQLLVIGRPHQKKKKKRAALNHCWSCKHHPCPCAHDSHCYSQGVHSCRLSEKDAVFPFASFLANQVTADQGEASLESEGPSHADQDTCHVFRKSK